MDKTFRQSPLVNQVMEILSSRISKKIYPINNRLPSEIELAKELEVSRATIRRAMDLLVERGLIYRRHGIGSFVSNEPVISNPLSQFIDFREMLFAQGFVPGLVELSAKITKADPRTAKLLHIEPYTTVLETHKYFTANDEMVVYCVNHIPLWIFIDVMKPEEVLKPGVMEPILDFYEKRCGKRIEYYACTIRTELVKDCNIPYLSEHFKPNTPVIIIDEVGYSAGNQPLHHSLEYHPGNHMQFGLIRLLKYADSKEYLGNVRKAFNTLNNQFAAVDISSRLIGSD
ncbi:MAG: hypothetical protein A2Y53_02115 [Chloroflexi bacterium RBG_16_47_49]|nr:MAG: hypothetical protein A2Y53_02115 [Chloroflexi bacterium RBG_16_47_49]